MRNVVTASQLIEELRLRASLEQQTIDALFSGVPVDFPVRFRNHLPFGVDRLGMAGITLFRSVHLLDRLRNYPPRSLLLLLRHEAEHVRQQRESMLFYPRYLFEWIRNLLGDSGGGAEKGGGFAERWHRAYMAIAAEEEAYSAEERGRILLDGK